jgi:RimJ/RimL family protein N-acetyltransferase
MPEAAPDARVTVTLAVVTQALVPAVMRLRPLPDQVRFSGVPSDTLPAAIDAAGREPVAVLDDGVPVGFFILDRNPVFATIARAPDTLGVRAFFVDREHQGRGIGTAALLALPAFVAARHPDVRHLALTVNVQNPIAVRAYKRAGFLDTGRLDHSGSHGPQHVLLLTL